jgi:hypothetical protein
MVQVDFCDTVGEVMLFGWGDADDADVVWDGTHDATCAVLQQIVGPASSQRAVAVCDAVRGLLKSCAHQWSAMTATEAVEEAERLSYDWLGDGDVLHVGPF